MRQQQLGVFTFFSILSLSDNVGFWASAGNLDSEGKRLLRHRPCGTRAPWRSARISPSPARHAAASFRSGDVCRRLVVSKRSSEFGRRGRIPEEDRPIGVIPRGLRAGCSVSHLWLSRYRCLLASAKTFLYFEQLRLVKETLLIRKADRVLPPSTGSQGLTSFVTLLTGASILALGGVLCDWPVIMIFGFLPSPWRVRLGPRYRLRWAPGWRLRC